MQGIKKGKDWAACYDHNYGRYLARLGYASYQGSESFIYVISKDVFDRLGSFSKAFDNNELIQKKGTLLYRSEDTRYGTMGFEEKEYEKNAYATWESAYQSAIDRVGILADTGNKLALMTWLGLQYNCYGDAKKQQQIQHYLNKAAECGLRSAQGKLGSIYCFGKKDLGVQKDMKKAVYWFIKFAENEDKEDPQDPSVVYLWDYLYRSYSKPEALCHEGYTHLTGKGKDRDYEKAVCLFAEAAANGDTDAKNNLGYCYEHGYGIEQNYEKALFWYAKAAEEGSDYGKNNLKLLQQKLSENQ